MANATTLGIVLDDTSPTVQYYPYGDTFGEPNLLGGWNPYYTGTGFAPSASASQPGEGTSWHLTAYDGATISLSFYGV